MGKAQKPINQGVSEDKGTPGAEKPQIDDPNFQSRVPREDIHLNFKRLLVESSILDKRQNVDPVIEYIQEFDMLREMPIHYQIKFQCAVKAVKRLWEVPVMPSAFYAGLLFEMSPLNKNRPSIIQKQYWFKCELDEKDRWLEQLDIWMTGCKTLDGFLKATDVPERKDLLKNLAVFEQEVKFKIFSLPDILENDSELLIEADENGSLSEEAKERLKELYFPVKEYISQLLPE